MALNQSQTSKFEGAIAAYAFPSVYFDFDLSTEVRAENMRLVENAIRAMLTSETNGEVLNGLSNVIYWGYAQIGYRKTRVRKFRDGAAEVQLNRFRALVASPAEISLETLAALKLPEFSGISFLSKILAFLDPVNYCVLDKQLLKLAERPGDRALHRVSAGTQIRVTPRNREAYDGWRQECTSISAQYFEGRYRVVDVERGFFQLVQLGDVAIAQEVYASA